MNRMLEPMLFVNGWRFLQIGVFIHLWIIGDASTMTFILLLLLLVITSLRWRFRLPTWTVFLDIIICLLYVPYTDISYYGLAMPIFELAFRGKWLISLLLFVSLFFYTSPSFLFWYYVQAFFFGVYSSVMIKNQHMYKLEADEQRKARYELERVRMDWLSAVQSASHQAELMERYRISRQLHDHLGHDLTGASLALQAYEYIEEPEEAKKLFQEVKHRIERSTTRLRETVHNVTPTAVIGVERLEHIVRNFG